MLLHWIKQPFAGLALFIKKKISSRNKGTPQGGVVSPVLSNLFLHYVFDKWLQKHYPNAVWCRYADDGLIHCRSEAEAKQMLEVLTKRFHRGVANFA